MDGLKPEMNEDGPYYNPKLTVESQDNHIYFYTEIDADRGLALIKTLRGLDATLRGERETREVPEDFPLTPIWLHLNSPGGELFSAFAVADQIQKIPSEVYTVVEGMAASAATIVSVVGDRRFIAPSAYMMIHQFDSMVWGKHEDFKDEMVLQEMLMDRLTGHYKEHTNMTKAEIKALLMHDSWFDAARAIKRGLADELYER